MVGLCQLDFTDSRDMQVRVVDKPVFSIFVVARDYGLRIRSLKRMQAEHE